MPGLECSRCEKIVHATPLCSKLSNKQLITIRNANGVEWSCEDCMGHTSRRSSFFVPEDDSDAEEETTSNNLNQDVAKKLLRDISSEMKKILKKELECMQTSLNFIGDQMSMIEETIKKQETKVKILENRTTDLQNKNKNLELRMACMEQQMQAFEQKQINNHLEIAGLPDENKQDPGAIVSIIATKLKMDPTEVQAARRLPARKDLPGPVLVELKGRLARDQWITAAKQMELTVGDIISNVPQEKAAGRIFIREALTQHTKSLLYQAKQQLRPSYEFVWCKAGRVYARETNNSKIHIVRSLLDIETLLK